MKGIRGWRALTAAAPDGFLSGMHTIAQPQDYFAARTILLSPRYALQPLEYDDVLLAGHHLTGDRQGLRIYDMAPSQWHPLGIRIAGRTAVELTRDEHAAFIADAAAQTIEASGAAIPAIVDPFVGSGNLLFHLARRFPAARAVGIDNSSEISRATASNFNRLQVAAELMLDDWTAMPRIVAALYVVCPPWGDAFGPDGLDLRRTTPPVPDILAALPRPGYALVQMKTDTVSASIDAIDVGNTALPTLRSGNPDIDRLMTYRLLVLR